MGPKYLFARLWLIAIVILWIVTGAVGYIAYRSLNYPEVQHVYILASHLGSGVFPTFFMFIFACVYWALGRSQMVDIDHKMAWGHLVGFIVGLTMVLAPAFRFFWVSMAGRYQDYLVNLDQWNQVRVVGAGLIVLSLILFVVVIFRFLRNRRKKRA